jgi:Fe-S-cluster containining protein
VTEDGGRVCGPCSLCCTVLRVDELAKLGGRDCLHQRPQGGCRVHARRPAVCRAYRCAWLGGAFETGDRPDALRAVLDLVPRGGIVHLVVRQAEEDALEASPRLQAIVGEMRESLPVEIRDAEDVLDPDRPYRVLYPGDEEQRVEGETVRIFRGDREVARQRAPWLERQLRRAGQRVQAWRLRRWPSHADRLAALGLPGDKLPGPRSLPPRQEESR